MSNPSVVHGTNNNQGVVNPNVYFRKPNPVPVGNAIKPILVASEVLYPQELDVWMDVNVTLSGSAFYLPTPNGPTSELFVGKINLIMQTQNNGQYPNYNQAFTNSQLSPGCTASMDAIPIFGSTGIHFIVNQKDVGVNTGVTGNILNQNYMFSLKAENSNRVGITLDGFTATFTNLGMTGMCFNVGNLLSNTTTTNGWTADSSILLPPNLTIINQNILYYTFPAPNVPTNSIFRFRQSFVLPANVMCAFINFNYSRLSGKMVTIRINGLVVFTSLALSGSGLINQGFQEGTNIFEFETTEGLFESEAPSFRLFF